MDRVCAVVEKKTEVSWRLRRVKQSYLLPCERRTTWKRWCNATDSWGFSPVFPIHPSVTHCLSPAEEHRGNPFSFFSPLWLTLPHYRALTLYHWSNRTFKGRRGILLLLLCWDRKGGRQDGENFPTVVTRTGEFPGQFDWAAVQVDGTCSQDARIFLFSAYKHQSCLSSYFLHFFGLGIESSVIIVLIRILRIPKAL